MDKENPITIEEMLSWDHVAVKTLDGKYAMLIIWREPLGFQVHGEEEIRFIPLELLKYIGGHAFEEMAPA